MTMSGNIWEHSAVYPLMADETDVGMEAPVTYVHRYLRFTNQ